MKTITLFIFVALVLLAIVNIWFDVISAAVFWKLTVTLGLIWCLAFVVKIVRARDEK